MTPTKIGFEKQCSDKGGVEYAVYYDGSDPEPQVMIESGHTVRLPIDQLDRLIESLQKIRQLTAPTVVFREPGFLSEEARELFENSFLKHIE